MSDATHPRLFGNADANLRFLDATGVTLTGRDVLEIGTGTGAMLEALQDRGCRMQGVEVNAELMAEARRFFGDLPITAVNSAVLPFPDQSFDVVVSFDVLEHIPDTDAHLAEVRRVLRPGGWYLLQTPNKWANTVFETIRWRSFTAWRADHCSLHSMGGLKQRLHVHGFAARFYDIPVVNAFFRDKVRRYAGWPGTVALRLLNPDRLPLSWRTNLWAAAVLQTGRADSERNGA